MNKKKISIVHKRYAEKVDLISQINIESLQEAEDILKSAGSEDLFEKAKHQDGDMHPNGKWVWVSSANGGKGDWRTKGGRTHTKHSAGGNAGTGSTTTTQQKPNVQVKHQTEKSENKVDESIDFEIKRGDFTYEYKGKKINEKIVESALNSNRLKYLINDKIKSINAIDKNKEYNPEQIKDLFKSPEPHIIPNRMQDAIVADFKDSIDNIDGKVDEKFGKNLISSVVPFSLKYAREYNNVTFSDFKVTKIGTLEEKIIKGRNYDLMPRQRHGFYEVSYIVKTKKKKIKIKTYLIDKDKT